MRSPVLLLDTARFKYSPHWVDADLVYGAVDTMDPDGFPRGFILVMLPVDVDAAFFRGLRRSHAGALPIVNNCSDVQNYLSLVEGAPAGALPAGLRLEPRFPDFFVDLALVYMAVRSQLVSVDADVERHYASDSGCNE